MGLGDYLIDFAGLNPEWNLAKQQLKNQQLASQAFGDLGNQIPGGPGMDGPPTQTQQGQSALLKLAQADPRTYGTMAAESMSPGQQLDNLVKRAQTENIKSETMKNEIYPTPDGQLFIHNPNTGEFKLAAKFTPAPISDAGKIAFDLKNQPALAAAASQQDGSSNPLMDTVKEAMMPPSQRDALAKQREQQATAVETARQKMISADQTAEQLKNTISRMKEINPDVPYGDYGSETAKEVWSNMSPIFSDHGKAAKAAGDWDQLNSQGLVTGISQLASSGSVGRLDLPIVNAVKTASGIPKTLNPKARDAMLDQLGTIAETHRIQAHNQYAALTGQPTQPLPSFSNTKTVSLDKVKADAQTKGVPFQDAVKFLQSKGYQIK